MSTWKKTGMAKSKSSDSPSDKQSFEQNALSILYSAWSEIEATPIDRLPTNELSETIRSVFDQSEIGWKYTIVNQIAGKVANFNLDALCLQKGAGQTGSWEPREFAKRVVVVWNKSIGAPLGDSEDPYVNNIFRNPRFDASMRKGRRKPVVFDAVLTVLEHAQAATSTEDVTESLKIVLAQLRIYLVGKKFDYAIPQRVSLINTVGCIEEYLKKSSGGARLQAVAYGLLIALKKRGLSLGEIASGHVNAADSASLSAGDIECVLDGKNLLTLEVKDRELTSAEMESSVRKARLSNVTELLFFVHRPTRTSPLYSDIEAIQKIVNNQFSLGLNIYIVGALELLEHCCVLLGEEGRKSLLVSVGEALDTQRADPKHRWDWSTAVGNIGTA